MTRNTTAGAIRRGFLLALTTAVLSACGRDDSPGDATSDDMPGMEGMPGMETGQAGGEDMAGTAMDGTIRLTASEIGTFGITFGMAEVRPLSRTIRVAGSVEFDETRVVRVAPKFAGWADRLFADFAGRMVREREPLLEVYAPELVTAQEELLLAARMASELEESPVGSASAGAGALLEAARRRLAYWDISPEQIDGVLESGEVRRTLTLRAPRSGVVTEKHVVEGQAFQAGTTLYAIAGLDEVWIDVEVFETDAGLVAPGMSVDVEVSALPDRVFAGRVDYVYPTLEDRTRSMRARVVLPNPGRVLKPGMYATAHMRVELGETLALPRSAVLRTGERAVAFVDMGGGTLMPHELELGLEGDGFVQVLAGLEAGSRVVTSAQFLLDSESNLAEVIQAMMMQMGSGDMDDMEGMDEMDMDGPGGGADMPGMDMPAEPLHPDSAGGN